MKHYHYIFTGAGLSALMTVYEMVLSGKFSNKTILLIDQDAKKTNDRTWCFWDDKSEYDNLVYKKWHRALFKNQQFKREMLLDPDSYQMIKGVDFYKFIFDVISKAPNVTFLHQQVLNFQETDAQCIVKTTNQNFTCDTIVNSIYNSDIVAAQSQYPLIQQHFIGWFIKSKIPVFNAECATFMDFSIEQKGNTRFMYVLPMSENEALIEYTLFSKELLLIEEYENGIRDYILSLGISDYEITEKEKGSIPMTAYPFWKQNTKNIINIGSAGGWTKASTGYTFKNSIKKSKALVQFLSSGKDLKLFHKKNKFWWYDLLLLDILAERNESGAAIFSSLFEKGNPSLIFRFLDEETSFAQDLQVILKCPKRLFIKALLKRFF